MVPICGGILPIGFSHLARSRKALKPRRHQLLMMSNPPAGAAMGNSFRAANTRIVRSPQNSARPRAKPAATPFARGTRYWEDRAPRHRNTGRMGQKHLSCGCQQGGIARMGRERKAEDTCCPAQPARRQTEPDVTQGLVILTNHDATCPFRFFKCRYWRKIMPQNRVFPAGNRFSARARERQCRFPRDPVARLPNRCA